MDAEVMLLDRSPERLRSLEAYRSGRLMSIVSSRGAPRETDPHC